MNWRAFAKALVPAVIGALLAALDMAVSGHVDPEHLRALVAGLLAAAAVYFTPNKPPGLPPPIFTRPPATAHITVPNTRKDPTTMDFQIQDDETGKTLAIIYLDVAGQPTSAPAGVTATYSLSDPSIATADPATGAITETVPVKLGEVQGNATLTNPDGSPGMPVAPATIVFVAGPAVSAQVVVA